MRFASAIVAAAAAAIASAQVVFPFAPEGPCVAACTDVAGKSFFPLYDDVDANGPFFFTSLSYTFERGTPMAIAFMTKAGTCMNDCPMDQQNAYRASYYPKYNWYQANKPAPLRRRA
ncbi:hypothetical protein BKA57DRAFT_501844 [Linnemannia elongata]|uniref:Uncharacterized protein n=1 Tax=Linnemannia elongata AG-77 TaxID=1314771 RepID=A0A197KAR5_9FUNG|nr:hypothetical protein BKA57DRAFT_501844 [Linnemannia elongata]KAK5808019.1 hypothetical protein F5H01DRAFT_68015 [Linnemannia elongata]OAQ33781.1 hypothetical protein K457DRAFT_14985 [Linnemannia elongata AG-77]